MIKVITYGTFDLLHQGHIRLLKRAKKLGDYLIVGVTADDYDKSRGKINVQQSLMERIESVRETGYADQIIVEEYEGQKIDDIKKYGIDIFTIGSDWKNKFDYLSEYCKVIYLDRTQGISSSDLRDEKRQVKMGLVGNAAFLNKVYCESKFVNGLSVGKVYSTDTDNLCEALQSINSSSFFDLLNNVDVVYLRSHPKCHYHQIKTALGNGKHVLCESPISLKEKETNELFQYAIQNQLILMEGIKTAYSTAFNRLILMLKEGKIGSIVSVDSVCTSMRKELTDWDGMYEWGPTALLPIFKILGTDFSECRPRCFKTPEGTDMFTKVDFNYRTATASAKFGDGVKSEGELIISGTQGYVYVPAPWWNTEYFEIRYEDQNKNKRYFYNLEGEGIRYELLSFIRAIENNSSVNATSEFSSKNSAFKNIYSSIDQTTTSTISKIMDLLSNKTWFFPKIGGGYHK